MDINLIDQYDDSYKLRISIFSQDEILVEIKINKTTEQEVCLSNVDAKKLCCALQEYLKDIPD